MENLITCWKDQLQMLRLQHLLQWFNMNGIVRMLQLPENGFSTRSCSTNTTCLPLWERWNVRSVTDPATRRVVRVIWIKVWIRVKLWRGSENSGDRAKGYCFGIVWNWWLSSLLSNPQIKSNVLAKLKLFPTRWHVVEVDKRTTQTKK